MPALVLAGVLVVLMMAPGVLIWRRVALRGVETGARRRAALLLACGYPFLSIAALLGAAHAKEQGHVVREVVAVVLAVLGAALTIACVRRARERHASEH